MIKEQKTGTKIKFFRLKWRLILPLFIFFSLFPAALVNAAEQAPTTTEIVSILPSPAYIDQPVVISIQVASLNPVDGIPTGIVEIKSSQRRVCSFALDAAGGGSCTLSFAIPATVPLKAVYMGTNIYLPSASTEVNLLVKNKHTPVVSIVSDLPDPSILNRLVNVAIQLSSDGPLPTGAVTVWRSDATCKAPAAAATLDKCAIALAGGAGSCSLNLSAAGNVYLCAEYEGDTYTFTAQALPAPHRVSTSNTFTTITQITPEPSLLGEPVSVSYIVTSPDGQPGPGDLVSVSNGLQSCVGTIAAGACTLVFTAPHLQDVIAEYQGGTTPPISLQPSTSDIVVHRVNAAPTDILLSNNLIDRYAAASEPVALLTAVDPNLDETHVYSLVPGDGSTDNSIFTITGNKLMVNPGSLGNGSQVFLRVRATDPAGLSFEKALTLRVSAGNVVLPETGFAAGRITRLLLQPRDKDYQAFGSVTLEIPKLDVSINVVGVPYTAGGWDTSWLEDQAGWLNGTAFPGWEGNSVLAAHNFISNGTPGPFNQLQTLKWGDQILIHSYGETHVYEVRDVVITQPDQRSILRHEETSWLTLVTCKLFDEQTNTYRLRVVVRAVLVDIR